MSDEPVPAPSVIPPAVPVPSAGLNYSALARWGTGVGISAAVLALELTNHAPNGTFLQYVALPGLTFLGLHTAAKNLN